MKRIAVMTTAMALLVAGCGGGSDGGTGRIADDPSPTEIGGAPVKLAPQGDVPIPDLPAEVPGMDGGSTEAEVEILGEGADPLGQRPQDPLVLLARSPQEADLILRRVPAGARRELRDFGNWGSRALIVITGGGQPDPSHRVVLQSVNLVKGGKELQVSVIIERDQGSAAQVISEPWAVISLNVAATVLVEECFLVFRGRTIAQGGCH